MDAPHVSQSSSVSSKHPFIKSLPLVNHFKDGRVVRLDTFSKHIAPGMRCGFVTAHPSFIHRLLMTHQAETD